MPRPKICVISATPLSVYFFFTEHLRDMSSWADVTLIYNMDYNPEVQPIGVPIVQKHIKIKREISLIDDLLGLFSLCRFFYRNKFDMVITLVPKAGFLGMLATSVFKIPVRIHIFQGEVWASRRGLRRLALWLADHLTASLSTRALAVSHSERHFLINEGIINAKKIKVLGSGSISGVDCERFRPNKAARAKLRNELNIPEASILLVFVGRLTKDKGVFELVKAFSTLVKSHRDIFLVLVGPDEDGLTHQLQTMINTEVAGQLKIAGFTQNPAIFIAAADILCIPSYREGFGVVALEAAACQVPVVGSDIHGLRDAVIHEETGLLIELGNEDALLSALNRLIDNPNLRKAYGKRGRSRALEKFKTQNVVDNYVKYFKRSLSLEDNDKSAS